MKTLIKQNKGKSEYLFFNNIRYRAIEYNDLKLFLRRMQESIGIDKLHAHLFRRTFATKLHEIGASLAAIQMLLGHETIEMTRNYIEVNMKTITREYEKYSLYK